MMLDKYAYLFTALVMMAGTLTYLGSTTSFEMVYLAGAAIVILALLSILWNARRRSSSPRTSQAPKVRPG